MRMSTSNSKHGSFFFKNNENTYPKGRSLMQMYRVVPKTKQKELLEKRCLLFFTFASTGTDGGLDFGTIKVMDEVKQTCTLKNKGKYDIAFK